MRSRDYIFVKNLAVKAVAGLDAWQRPIAQPLQLSLRINVGHRLKLLGRTDDLRRTLNYDLISTEVVNKVEANPSGFASGIEEVARTAAATIAAHTAPYEWVHVSAKQPRAHLRAASRQVDVTTEPARRNSVTERLNRLSVASIIGVNELERVHKQNIVLDLQVERGRGADVFTAAFTDAVVAHVEGSSFLTLESFANSVAELVCTQAVSEVTVCAQKPSALNLADAACIEVVRRPGEPTYDAPADVGGGVADVGADVGGGVAGAAADHCVYIAFGTNEGDCVANIQRVVRELAAVGVVVEQTSAIYESEPLYYTEQPPFLNGVLRCRTALEPRALLDVLKRVEYGMFHRVKQFDNGPRTMDLDIILFDNILLESDVLTIPHRDMLNRSFVLLPLRDVMPNCPFPEVSSGETTVVPLAGSARVLRMDARGQTLPTALMAIMNATPDSFSDGGDLKHESAEHVVARAREHIANGASILDIGGYSTRPGAAPVCEAEELRRVTSTIGALREHNKDVVISVDTFRSRVAEAALGAGANMVNDVFSGTLDARILGVAAAAGAPLVLSHARGTPATMKSLTSYPHGVVAGVAAELRARVDAALRAGCRAWQLVLDPGLGFAKTPAQDIELVRRLGELKRAPALTNGLPVLPWLVGPSRKSFIGAVSGETQPKLRGPGTLAVATALVQQGADIVRVHDSHAAAQALRVADAIYR